MSIKTKLGAAMLSTALGAALVSGGSYALFTDDAVIKNNSFSTGTVDLKVNGQDQTEQGFFNVSNFAPGDSELGNDIKVSNAGSLDLFYRILPVNVKVKTPQTDDWVTLFDENGNFLGLPNDVHLNLSKLHILVKDKMTNYVVLDLFADPNHSKGIRRLDAKSFSANHDTDQLVWSITLDKDAGNEFQRLELKGDLKFQAVQAKNNQNKDGGPDSWGN
ncbi:TasA family protein [Camelliibacillus cellulosilyticus]|uniref:TasA family protein n=1 Tax=Camelliibacillus cellulosilyticus TaxID=2174486 RepID=A0ABV9GL96_9BACL